MKPSLFDDFGRSIDERFEQWLIANPWVFPRFCNIALEAKREGQERWSADHLLAIIRWKTRHTIKRDGKWRCNDHFTSRLSRKAMAEVPELDGFFEIRKLRS